MFTTQNKNYPEMLSSCYEKFEKTQTPFNVDLFKKKEGARSWCFLESSLNISGELHCKTPLYDCFVRQAHLGNRFGK